MLPYEHKIILYPEYSTLCLWVTFASRADAFENNIMPSKYETVCILDGFLQIGFIFHIHIKNTATLYTFCMIMIAA